MLETGELRIGGIEIADILGIEDDGITYKAKDDQGRDIVLKVVGYDYPTLCERLEAEFSLYRLLELQHPNLSTIWGVGFTENGKLWFTRSFLPGDSIINILRQIDVLGAQILLLQIVDALDFLHRNGFVHGNLKGENVRVIKQNSNGGGLWEFSRGIDFPFTVKLMDYGLVKPSDLLRGDSILPSPPCERTDLIHLGMMLYEAFVGEDDNKPPQVNKIREHVPEPLQMIVFKLLGLGCDEPFQSAQQIAFYLSELAPKSSKVELSLLPKSIFMAKDAERRSFLMDILTESKQKGRFVLIDGEEGSGKSVLVREFASLAALQGNQVSVTTCMSRYNPLEPILRFLSDITSGLKHINPALLKANTHIIDRMMGFKDLDSSRFFLNTSEMFEAFQAFLTEVCQITPLVLIVEDLDLASEQILLLLNHLQSGISDMKLMLIATYAPSHIRGDQQYLFDAITTSEGTVHVQVNPLDYNGTISFTRFMLAMQELPEPIIAQFYESTGGNVFRIQEMIRIALNDGILQFVGGHAIFNDRKFAEMRKIHDPRILALKLLDNLTPDENTLCRFVSVLGGRAKLIELVEAIGKSKQLKSNEPRYIANLIFTLIAKGILRKRFEASGFFFAMSHNVYTETILQNVISGTRKDIYDNIHRTFLQAPSEIMPIERDIRLASLALKGNEPIAAFQSVPIAASTCLRQMAFTEAKFHLIKLLQMVPEIEKEYSNDCMEKIATCDLSVGNFTEALDILDKLPMDTVERKALKAISAYKVNSLKSGLYIEEALLKADEIEDSNLKRRLISTHLDFLQDNDPEAAISFAQNRSRSTEDPITKIDCLLSLSTLQAAVAEFDLAEKSLSEAVSIATTSNLTNLHAKAALYQVRLAQMKGENDKASRLLRKSIGLVASSYDLKVKAEYYSLLAKDAVLNRDFSTALSSLRAQVAAESKRGSKRELAKSLLELGSILDSKGQTKEASHMIERARRLAEEVGDNKTIGRALTFIGDYYLGSGGNDQALISFERAEKILSELGDTEFLAKTTERLGKIWLEAQDFEKAKTYSKLLQNLADSTAEPHVEAVASKLGGAIAAFQEKWEKAEEMYLKALDIMERSRMSREANLLKIDLSDLFVKQGEYFRALSKLSEARLFFEEEDSSAVLKRIRQTELFIDKELGKYGEDYRNLRMLLEISKALSLVDNLDELLPMIIDMALKVSGAERGFIMLLTPKGKLDFKVGRSQKKENLEHEMFQFSSTVTDSALFDRKLVCITDTATDEKFRNRDSIVGLSLRSVMCGPLRVGEQMLGVIYVDSQVPTFYFSRKNAEFFDALCSHASIAINQARLHTQALQQSRIEEENHLLKQLDQRKKESLLILKQKLRAPVIELEAMVDSIQKASLTNPDLVALAYKAKGFVSSISKIVDESIKEPEKENIQ